MEGMEGMEWKEGMPNYDFKCSICGTISEQTLLIVNRGNPAPCLCGGKNERTFETMEGASILKYVPKLDWGLNSRDKL
jgi:hypothetical protein